MTAALVFATLSGCAPSPNPSHTPSSTPRATPVFSSDKEALAAATEAYAAYAKVSDEIAHDGGAHPERIKEFVTRKQYGVQSKDFESLRTKEYVAEGSTTFDSVRLQHFSTAAAIAEIAIYVCVDVSGVQLLDSAGENATPADRPDRLPLEVVFVSARNNSAKLLVDESKLWSGENFC